MLSKMNLLFAGALTILPQLAFATDNTGARSVAAVSGSLPTVSIENLCRYAEFVALPESRSTAYDACIKNERLAFEQLQQGWANYSTEARSTCAESGGGVPESYVELQTCLDLQPGGKFSARGSDGASFDSMASPAP